MKWLRSLCLSVSYKAWAVLGVLAGVNVYKPIHDLQLPQKPIFEETRATAPWRLGLQIAMTAVFIALAFFRRRIQVREERAVGGLCEQCGYDLRASAERCPECGAAITRQS